MTTKDDLRLLALALPDVREESEGSYVFKRDGRNMIWPYPERIHPKKARVPRYDQYCIRVADADDKEALLAGEPEVFFTTDHYDGYNSVIVRLDAIDEERLGELVEMAWQASPLSTSSRKPAR